MGNAQASTQNSALKSALPATGQRSEIVDWENGLKDWFRQKGRQLISLCGSEDTARRLVATAMSVVQKNPDIITCDFSTFTNCLLTSAELDLWPGALQQCAYVPMKVKGKMECQFWPMYKGHIKEMYASGMIESISCQIVHEHDSFDFEEGSKPHVHFKRLVGPEDERGKEIIGFCSIDIARGGRIVEIVGLDYIEKVKKTSRNQSEYGPWAVWPEAMKRKTCLKRGQRWAPQTERLAKIIELDNATENPELAKRNIIQLSGLGDTATAGAQTGTSQPGNQEQARLPEPPTGIVMPERRDPEAEMLESDRELAANKGGRSE